VLLEISAATAYDGGVSLWLGANVDILIEIPIIRKKDAYDGIFTFAMSRINLPSSTIALPLLFFKPSPVKPISMSMAIVAA
jgi:hypothetical protein